MSVAEINEFYDIFIIDPNSGNIVYSVFKEVDFATSLENWALLKQQLSYSIPRVETSNRPERQRFLLITASIYLPITPQLALSVNL